MCVCVHACLCECIDGGSFLKWDISVTKYFRGKKSMFSPYAGLRMRSGTSFVTPVSMQLLFLLLSVYLLHSPAFSAYASACSWLKMVTIDLFLMILDCHLRTLLSLFNFEGSDSSPPFVSLIRRPPVSPGREAQM